MRGYKKIEVNIEMGEAEHQGLENCEIRGATTGDVPLITSIIRRSFADVAVSFGLTEKSTPTHPAYMTEERIREAMEKGVAFFVLENGGETMGTVAVEGSRKSPGVFYVERLSVLPKFRRRGGGGLLLKHAVVMAKAMGARRVEIGIISDQTELQRWYERHGFRAKEERKRFDHLPFTVTFMGMDV